MMKTKFAAASGLFGLALVLGALRASAQTPVDAQPGHLKVDYHGRFTELRLGAVKPRGWIKGWLERQADGLTGHPENLAYPYDTCMYAGKIPPAPVPHGDAWWPYEQSGYFLDGAVRLNHLIDRPDARRMPDAEIKYILENSGPAKLGESTYGWPNTVVGRALMAEHSATGNPKVAQVLADCLLGSHALGWRDGLISEEALYLYGLTSDQRLFELARRNYEHYFHDDPKSFSHVDRIRGDQPFHEHGVTAAEQLKLLPLWYCYTGDKEALELANLAYRKVEGNSLMPDGGMVSSESLGKAVFDSLHETCDLTDWSWSMGYLLMAGGEAHWADLIERTTFNALPGAVTKDFKQLQYFSSANQVLASDTSCARMAPTRMSYRAAHETECCTGNVNRAMPNYVARMWMRTENGLAATLLGPSEVCTAFGGEPVTVIEDTDYPFRDSVSFKVNASKPATFALELRIPEWCAAATVTVNGAAVGIDCKAGTFAVLKREYRDGDTVVMRVPMSVQLKDWFDGNGVSVQRGPLVYALKIDEKRVESQRDPDPIRRMLKGNQIQGFSAVEFFPASEWRYGMETSRKGAPDQFKIIEAPMPENPFLAGTVPVRMEVMLRALPQWEASWQANAISDDPKSAPKNPSALPSATELQSVGPARTMTLVPYGSTHLRLTTLPLIKSEKAPGS